MTDELRAPGTDDMPEPKGSPTNPYITGRQAAGLLVLVALAAVVAAVTTRRIR